MIARLYANEMFPLPVAEVLRTLGHDILTAQESGRAGRGIPDEEVLAYAIEEQRAVLTFNRRHFLKLHRLNSSHFGMVVCTEDNQSEALAQRIHVALVQVDTLEGRVMRIYRPA